MSKAEDQFRQMLMNLFNTQYANQNAINNEVGGALRDFYMPGYTTETTGPTVTRTTTPRNVNLRGVQDRALNMRNTGKLDFEPRAVGDYYDDLGYDPGVEVGPTTTTTVQTGNRTTAFEDALNRVGKSAVNSNYDAALAKARAKANMSGFGYAQPITNTAESGIEAERAHDLADVPLKSKIASIQPEMDAIRLRTGQAAMTAPTDYLSILNGAFQSSKNRNAALNAQLAQALSSVGSSVGSIWGGF